MFVTYGDIAFNLMNSSLIEKDGREIIVRYLPLTPNSSGGVQTYYFNNEKDCQLAWNDIKTQIHELNKRN